MPEETIQEDRILRDAASVLQRRAGRYAGLAEQLLALVISQVGTALPAATQSEPPATPSRARRVPRGRPTPPPGSARRPWEEAAPPKVSAPPAIQLQPPTVVAKPVAFLTKADLAPKSSAPAPAPCPPVVAEPAAETTTPETPPGPPSKTAERAQRIVGLVTAHPGAGLSQIRRWLRDSTGEDLNPGTLHHALNQLITDKRIIRDGGGYHPVTAADRG